jgi:hypothetical protein
MERLLVGREIWRAPSRAYFAALRDPLFLLPRVCDGFESFEERGVRFKSLTERRNKNGGSRWRAFPRASALRFFFVGNCSIAD